ncbi:alpha-1,3-mannosyl-glycoprotein 2-beta-N-acetylglucosaminyltransferase a [Pangasianodon hypophthalmus]|uniref:alpha-1,3-mannosyl-glycoprotein 2-beta-N-acetylglucosaminyltransferase a n=1 Tax=Pangasianodon hypophthalmus TaxID=310915 RepID=UPI000F0024FC|nr:alpha-1,3-mannosyl-glycoprotein 2-beta-N-acetylglucosaminyltransferase a [Pangasianodon hypophthalmus]XP_053095539.1 alpha-1,3-mannosyl-glycoprotein 2-beta-N-acetylglucosaminyltransferase a [Pangasianodon hypophthalmus]
MFRKKGSLIICGALLFIAWNALIIFVLLGRSPGYEGGKSISAEKDPQNNDIVEKLLHLISSFEMELESQNKILLQIQSHKSLWEELKKNGTAFRSKLDTRSNFTNERHKFLSSGAVIPILVMACNRVTVKRCLDKLLEYRPSPELFPIIVSQDCGHTETADMIASYGSKLTHIKQPDLSEISVPAGHNKFQGYYKISRHYRWALNQVFNSFSYSAVIIVEDDLEVAPDFFEYFKALHPVLQSDPTLWCVSAWNDNGRDGYVDPVKSSLLYRTDFFPGLGWMLLKEVWMELEPKWPASFWDDWMRHPDQRKDRSCIRPEVSRTLTFGRKGVSLGQFYDKYLRFIKLNVEFVPFTNIDLSYLEKKKYDQAFEKEVYSSPVVTLEELKNGKLSGPGPFRLQYSSPQDFKTVARGLGIMDDLKSGVPRAGYRGVVSFFSQGKRIYIAPPVGWTKYDPSWS